MSKAINDVIAERQRQQSVEGWTPEHDDQHEFFEISEAATAYVQNAADFGHAFGSPIIGDWSEAPQPSIWPWDKSWWKPKSPRQDLVRAAALIIAEIERLDRKESTHG